MEYRSVIKFVVYVLWSALFFISCEIDEKPLGQNEAIRVYVEFADGTNRGIYNEKTGQGGFPDEDYDATTAMVISWHKLPERDTTFNARLEYLEQKKKLIRVQYFQILKWETLNIVILIVMVKSIH